MIAVDELSLLKKNFFSIIMIPTDNYRHCRLQVHMIFFSFQAY